MRTKKQNRYENPLVVGIDVGGTNIKGCREGGDAEARHCARLSHSGMKGRGKKGGPLRMLSLIEEIVYDLTDGQKPDALAFTMPAMLNSATGKLLAEPPNLGGTKKSWLERNLYTDLRRRFSCPVVGGNDVDFGIYAEKAEGCLTDLDPLHKAVSIFVGGGVGGGLLSLNKIYLGSFSSSVEIGHFPIDTGFIEPRECGCGGLGHIEAHASVTALLKMFRVNAAVCGKDDASHSSRIGDARRIDDDTLTKKIFELRANSDAADAAIEEMVFGLASAAKTVATAYGPARIVFGGGIMGEGKSFLREIRARFLELNHNTCFLPSARKIKFQLASCGSLAGAIGAMHKARDLVSES